MGASRENQRRGGDAASAFATNSKEVAMRMSSGLMIAAGLVAVMNAAPATAQTALAMAGDPIEKAVDLERKAQELYGQPTRYVQAARLHVRASQLRSAADPMRVRNLSMAARLYYYAGMKSEALSTMQSAADAALAVGDLLTAANHLVDASHLAVETGNREEAVNLTDRAKLLTASPLLDATQRAQIETRLKIAIL
jgi:hypothetical protein